MQKRTLLFGNRVSVFRLLVKNSSESSVYKVNYSLEAEITFSYYGVRFTEAAVIDFQDLDNIG